MDLKQTHTITNAEMATQCGWTPFDGAKVIGMPKATIVRGQIAMRDGEVLGGPIGQPILFR